MRDKKRILFVCVENSCRSQIAEGFAKYLADNNLEVFSAGSRPKDKVNPLAIEVMKEVGIDISDQKPKSFKDLPIKEFDYVVSLGCKEMCPFFPARKHIEWQILDPQGKDINFFRQIRDQIKEKIESLLKEII